MFVHDDDEDAGINKGEKLNPEEEDDCSKPSEAPVTEVEVMEPELPGPIVTAPSTRQAPVQATNIEPVSILKRETLVIRQTALVLGPINPLSTPIQALLPKKRKEIYAPAHTPVRVKVRRPKSDRFFRVHPEHVELFIFDDKGSGDEDIVLPDITRWIKKEVHYKRCFLCLDEKRELYNLDREVQSRFRDHKIHWQLARVSAFGRRGREEKMD